MELSLKRYELIENNQTKKSNVSRSRNVPLDFNDMKLTTTINHLLFRNHIIYYI